VPRKNKVDTYGALVLQVIITPLFYQPKCLVTPMSIMCIVDFYVDRTLHDVVYVIALLDE